MSGIPTSIINVNFPDDGGDPAGGGGGSNSDMKVVQDILRNVQASVATINQNVRSILEAVRKIAAQKPSAVVEAVKSASKERTRAVRSERLKVERVYQVDPRKQIIPYAGGQWTWGEREDEMRSAARSYRERAPQPITDVRRLLTGTTYPSGAPLALGSAGMRPPITNPRFLLPSSVPTRALTVLPPPMPLAPAAPPSPTPPAPPPPPPPRPPGPMPDPGGEAPGFMQSVGNVISIVGRVLSVGRLIMGVLSEINNAVKAIMKFATDQRKILSRVDPVIAQQEAQLMIARLRQDIAVGQDPSVRSATRFMTDAEMVSMRYMTPIRALGVSLSARATGTFAGLQAMGAKAVGGLVSGNFSQFAQAYGEMTLAKLSWLFGGWLGLSSFVSKWISAQGTNTATQANQLFVDDLRALTGFDPLFTQAYPQRSKIRTSGAGNWWTP